MGTKSLVWVVYWHKGNKDIGIWRPGNVNQHYSFLYLFEDWNFTIFAPSHFTQWTGDLPLSLILSLPVKPDKQKVLSFFQIYLQSVRPATNWLLVQSVSCHCPLTAGFRPPWTLRNLGEITRIRMALNVTQPQWNGLYGLVYGRATRREGHHLDTHWRNEHHKL